MYLMNHKISLNEQRNKQNSAASSWMFQASLQAKPTFWISCTCKFNLYTVWQCNYLCVSRRVFGSYHLQRIFSVWWGKTLIDEYKLLKLRRQTTAFASSRPECQTLCRDFFTSSYSNLLRGLRHASVNTANGENYTARSFTGFSLHLGGKIKNTRQNRALAIVE